MFKNIEEIYPIIDEITRSINKQPKKGWKGYLSISETLTILIEGHVRNYHTEKQLYAMISNELSSCFRRIPSYA